MFAWLRKDSRGFTLVELMMVIVVLGILAGVAIPMVGNIRANAEKNKVASLVDTAVTAITLNATETGTAPADAAAVAALISLPTNVEVVALAADFTKAVTAETPTATCTANKYCIGYKKDDTGSTNKVRLAGFTGGTTAKLIDGTYREINLSL